MGTVAQGLPHSFLIVFLYRIARKPMGGVSQHVVTPLAEVNEIDSLRPSPQTDGVFDVDPFW